MCANVCQSFSISFCPAPGFDHEDSDSEHERFQKILSQKFEWREGLSHGAKIGKFREILHLVMVWDHDFAWGFALRAMFKINMVG